MNESDSNKMTPFDAFISSKDLQLLKLLIPYIPENKQRSIAILIKFLELQNTIHFFEHMKAEHCNIKHKHSSNSPIDILSEIQPYLPADEQNALDSFLNTFDMLELFSSDLFTKETQNKSEHSN